MAAICPPYLVETLCANIIKILTSVVVVPNTLFIIRYWLHCNVKLT